MEWTIFGDTHFSEVFPLLLPLLLLLLQLLIRINVLWFPGLSMEGLEQRTRAAPFTPRIPDGEPVLCPLDIDLEDEPEPRRYSGKFDYSGF
jgi:hypothetical protein